MLRLAAEPNRWMSVSHFNYVRDNLLLIWMHTRLLIECLVRMPALLIRRLRAYYFQILWSRQQQQQQQDHCHGYRDPEQNLPLSAADLAGSGRMHDHRWAARLADDYARVIARRWIPVHGHRVGAVSVVLDRTGHCRAGHTGHGEAMATAGSEIVTVLVLGNDSDSPYSSAHIDCDDSL